MDQKARHFRSSRLSRGMSVPMHLSSDAIHNSLRGSITQMFASLGVQVVVSVSPTYSEICSKEIFGRDNLNRGTFARIGWQRGRTVLP